VAVNRADRLHAALADGKPHTRGDIFRAAGSFFLTNNAASELRSRGIEVVQWRPDGEYVYQLVGALGEAPPPRADGGGVSPNANLGREPQVDVGCPAGTLGLGTAVTVSSRPESSEPGSVGHLAVTSPGASNRATSSLISCARPANPSQLTLEGVA
jgi:hypothetical protein